MIDSLYRGYPAGYIIVWQNPDVKLKDGSLSLGKKILIDGQQRVTAIITAIDGRSVLRDDYSSKQIKIAFNPWAVDEEPSFEVQTPVHVKDKRWIADISVLFKKDFDDYEFIKQYVADNPGVERKAINAKIRRDRGCRRSISRARFTFSFGLRWITSETMCLRRRFSRFRDGRRPNAIGTIRMMRSKRPWLMRCITSHIASRSRLSSRSHASK